MQALNAPVTTTRNLSGLGMALNEQNTHNSYFEACMLAKGYQKVAANKVPYQSATGKADGDSHSKTAVKITSFQQLPDSIMSGRFVVVPANNTNSGTDLKALTYANFLTHLMESRGLKSVSLNDITNAQYVFFLRYKDTDKSSLPANAEAEGLHACSVRVDVDAWPLATFDTASLSSTDIFVATTERYDQALAVCCALRHYATTFPFNGANPYHHEFYYPTELEENSP